MEAVSPSSQNDTLNNLSLSEENTDNEQNVHPSVPDQQDLSLDTQSESIILSDLGEIKSEESLNAINQEANSVFAGTNTHTSGAEPKIKLEQNSVHNPINQVVDTIFTGTKTPTSGAEAKIKLEQNYVHNPIDQKANSVAGGSKTHRSGAETKIKSEQNPVHNPINQETESVAGGTKTHKSSKKMSKNTKEEKVNAKSSAKPAANKKRKAQSSKANSNSVGSHQSDQITPEEVNETYNNIMNVCSTAAQALKRTIVEVLNSRDGEVSAGPEDSSIDLELSLKEKIADFEQAVSSCCPIKDIESSPVLDKVDVEDSKDESNLESENKSADDISINSLDNEDDHAKEKTQPENVDLKLQSQNNEIALQQHEICDDGTESIVKILASLESYATSDEKLQVLCQKHAGILGQLRSNESSLEKFEEQVVSLRKEKEQLQADHTRTTLAKIHWEGMYKELENQNKAIKPDKLEEKEDEVSHKKQQKNHTKKKGEKSVDQILKSLSSFSTADEKLQALCKKQIELVEEIKSNDLRFKQFERQVVIVTREKDQLQADHNRMILAKSRLEGVCRELQRQNKTVKEESLIRIREEEEKRKEVANKFQATLNDISALMQENSKKNLFLREENAELAKKLKALVDHYEMWEKHMEKVVQQKDLETQLAKAKHAKTNLLLKQETEKFLREKQSLLENMNELQKKCTMLATNELQLRTELGDYTSKYEEFQTVLNKSSQVFANFKTDMEITSKKIKKLEKETNFYKKKWEGSNTALLNMISDKQRQDKEITNAYQRILTLEKLCRALQAERNELQNQMNGLSSIAQVQTCETEVPLPESEAVATE